MKESGRLIRGLLKAKLIRPRDVERVSRSIADAKGNPEFYVSHATLAAIERGSVPSIYKVFSLALCCGVPYGELLSLFGVDTRETKAQEHLAALSRPSLEAPTLAGPTFPFRMNFDVGAGSVETNLLLDHPHDWRFPVDLLSRLQPGHFLYAVIGLNDDGMAEIIPPGSLVEIDREQRHVKPGNWRTTRERPIYLVWHERGYSCAWCQLTRNELLLIPHPLSQRPISRFRMPSEATVIGRIVHAWCSLVPVHDNGNDGGSLETDLVERFNS